MQKKPEKAGELFEELVQIVARLRDPRGGCPWDLEQTHQSLKPYLIEEAYETLDAIDSHPQKLAEELGDVLLQVMLHSQIGSDSGTFNIDDVVRHLSQKLVKRHPHVFGETSVKDSQQVLENWETIKAKDRSKQEGMLDGIPKALPALLKAQRIGAKVARVGFDWDTEKDICLKIEEELKEFMNCQSGAGANQAHAFEEFGDLLFTLVQLGRKLGFDCEDALAQANKKFMRRFAALEQLAGADLKSLGREKLEKLWADVKCKEKVDHHKKGPVD